MITENMKLEKLNRKEALRYLGYSGEQLDDAMHRQSQDMCIKFVILWL